MVTFIDSTPIRAAAVLDAVHAPAPKTTARAPETDAARRLPLELVRVLTEAGGFRMRMARSHGDRGVGLPGASSVCRRAI